MHRTEHKTARWRLLTLYENPTTCADKALQGPGRNRQVAVSIQGRDWGSEPRIVRAVILANQQGPGHVVQEVVVRRGVPLLVLNGKPQNDGRVDSLLPGRPPHFKSPCR